MNVKSLKIKNFKAIKNSEINLNEKLNVFTGVNNSGKTTLLEALALWTEIFYLLLKRAEKNSNKLNVKIGDFLFSNKTNYFDYSEFSSIRIVSYSEIFHNLDEKNPIEISVILESEKGELEIPFTIKSSTGKNFSVSLSNYEGFDYLKFNSYFDNRVKPISIYFANPINHLNKNEEKKVNETVEYAIASQSSETVFRNRLFRINSNPTNMEKLTRDLATILGEESVKIIFKKDSGRYHNLLLEIGDKTAKDISLYGSGTLQILQFLVNIYEDSSSDLKMILFDEPDSHIHRNIQKKLIEVLLREGEFQLFLTTHNESFIRNTEENSLFHIEGLEQPKLINPIGRMVSMKEKSGIMQTGKNSIIKELVGEEVTGLHFIEALEADRIIFIEGRMDAEFLETVFDRTLSITDKKKNIYWVFDGVDSIFKNLLKYKDVFTAIKNGKSLWEKTYLFIDRDFLNDKLRDELSENLQKQYKLKNYISDAYCMDSIFLKELDKLAMIIKNITKSKLSASEIMEILKENLRVEVSENYKIESVEKEFKEVMGKLKSSDFFKDKYQEKFFNDYGSATYERDILLNSMDAYKFINKESFYKIIEDSYSQLGLEWEVSGFLREVFEVIKIDSNLRPTEFETILQKLK